jgi:hypothetical protein
MADAQVGSIVQNVEIITPPQLATMFPFFGPVFPVRVRPHRRHVFAPDHPKKFEKLEQRPATTASTVARFARRLDSTMSFPAVVARQGRLDPESADDPIETPKESEPHKEQDIDAAT